MLDSLSTMLVYNDYRTISKFSNFILNTMRNNEIDTFILALKSDSDKDLIKYVEALADEVKLYD